MSPFRSLQPSLPLKGEGPEDGVKAKKPFSVGRGAFAFLTLVYGFPPSKGGRVRMKLCLGSADPVALQPVAQGVAADS